MSPIALFLLFLCLVACPIIFWIWFFRRNDIGDVEPKRFILKLVLLWGGLAILFSAGVEMLISDLVDPDILDKLNTFESGVDVGGFSGLLYLVLFLFASVEEFSKFIVLHTATYHSKYFTQVIDGMIYGVSVALGFALMENTIYFIGFSKEETMSAPAVVTAVFIRAIAPLMMHMITTGIVGLSLGKKKFGYGGKFVVGKALIGAVVIHMIYNSLVIFAGIFGFFIALILLAVTMAYLLKELFKDENRMIWKRIG